MNKNLAMKRVKMFGPGWIFVFSFTLAGCVQLSKEKQHPGKQEARKSFLWKVSGSNSVVFLLGTLWSTQGPPPVNAKMEEAYSASSIVVVPYTIEEAVSSNLTEQLKSRGKYPPGETIRGHVTRPTFETLEASFKGTTNEWERERPWSIGLSIVHQELNRHGFNGSNSIVGHFLSKAKADKKTVVSLERPDAFLNILSALPDIQAEWCLLQGMVESAYYSTNLNEIVDAWRSGDVKKLDNINLTHLQPFPYLTRKLTIDRNEAWLPRIEKLLAGQTNAFVIVYARHLVGRESLIELLELKGFKVEQL